MNFKKEDDAFNFYDYIYNTGDDFGLYYPETDNVGIVPGFISESDRYRKEALLALHEKMFKYNVVWEKSKPTNFLNARKQPLRKHEDVCIFYQKQPLYYPQMTKGKSYNKGVRKNQLSGSYGDFKPIEVKSNGRRFPTDIVYFKTAESESNVSAKSLFAASRHKPL